MDQNFFYIAQVIIKLQIFLFTQSSNIHQILCIFVLNINGFDTLKIYFNGKTTCVKFMCNSSMILKVMIVIRCHIFIDKKYCFIGQHRTFTTFHDNCDIYMPLVGFMNLLWHYTKTQIYIPCNYYLISLLVFVAGEREREREMERDVYEKT